MAKDITNLDFESSTKAAKKAIDATHKSKSIIPVELRLFLRGVPTPVIMVVIFMIIESFVGVGFTIYYLWEWVLGLALILVGWVVIKKIYKFKVKFKKD